MSVGTINDIYQIRATFTPTGSPEITVTEEIRSRTLNETERNNEDDGFHSDVDMLQRAMMQVHYLDKGRINIMRIGEYDANGDGFYNSSLEIRDIEAWSSIADEVENFYNFTMGQAKSQVVTMNFVEALWEEYDLIMEAGRHPNQIIRTHPSIAATIDNANASVMFAFPSGFSLTNSQTVTQDVMQALFRQEDIPIGRHRVNLHAPLEFQSVRVGEQNSKDGSHIFTDGGLGIGAIQPPNRDGNNLYDLQENITRSMEILRENVTSAGNPASDGNEKVWRACFRYNQGNFGTGTPAQLRASAPDTNNKKGADYADGIFGTLGLAEPQ